MRLDITHNSRIVMLCLLPSILVQLWERNFTATRFDSIDTGEAFVVESSFGDGFVRQSDFVFFPWHGLVFFVHEFDFNPALPFRFLLVWLKFDGTVLARLGFPLLSLDVFNFAGISLVGFLGFLGVCR